jgi:hypothetical protein
MRNVLNKNKRNERLFLWFLESLYRVDLVIGNYTMKGFSNQRKHQTRLVSDCATFLPSSFRNIRQMTTGNYSRILF